MSTDKDCIFCLKINKKKCNKMICLMVIGNMSVFCFLKCLSNNKC